MYLIQSHLDSWVLRVELDFWRHVFKGSNQSLWRFGLPRRSSSPLPPFCAHQSASILEQQHKQQTPRKQKRHSHSLFSAIDNSKANSSHNYQTEKHLIKKQGLEVERGRLLCQDPHLKASRYRFLPPHLHSPPFFSLSLPLELIPSIAVKSSCQTQL